MQMVNFVNGTTLFPKNMCAKEGIADMLTFSKGNMLSDLKNNYDGFMNNIFRRKMSEDVINLMNQRIFSGYFTGNVNEPLTYVSYLLFFKSLFYDWLSSTQTSVSNFFYGVIVPNYLYSLSFNGLAQVYGPVAVFISRQVDNLKDNIKMLNILSISAIIAVFGLIVVFRIRDGR